MTKRILVAVCALLMVAGAVLYAAQPPARNVNPHRHPHLAAAQRLAHQAWEKVTQAQQANEWDLGGHAARAKELLDQVNNELKQAAEAANENKR